MMKLFEKKLTWYKKKYNICGIKITLKRQLPSDMSLRKRVKALKAFFYSKVGYPLDIANPQTFNEKINWIKLFYQNALMTRIVDKYEFKNYIQEQLGDGYTVPLLGVWDNIEDIDFDKFPNQFVLKCNAQSDSKFIKVVRDKSQLDIDSLKNEMQDWLKPEKTLKTSFCWAYHNVPLKIIAEEYIEQIDGQVYDYKFMCFNGEPRWVLACCDRGKNTVYENHDMDWNLIIPSPKSATKAIIQCPKHFTQMTEIARKLAQPFPFVRVDFYEIKDSILIGEMTFYPNGGFNTYYPQWDKKFGDYINLPKIKIEHPFFEKVKYKNKRIIKVYGKKVLSYNKSLSRKELTKRLDIVNDRLKITQDELQSLKDNLKCIESDILSTKNKLKHIQMDLVYRPKLRPSQMSLEERIEALTSVFAKEAGYPLNLTNPQTFNEKINWMKLFYRNALMTRIVDKYEFKNYIKEQLGDGYTIPLLGVWDNIEDIDFDKLPNQFVLKCNAQSDSKFIKIVRDKSKLDIDALKKEMQDWLKPEKTLKTSFCWAYYNVPLKIIAEEYIENSGSDLYDYKFWCFNGEVKYIQFLSERNTNGLKMAFYDKEWNKQNFVYSYPLDTKTVEKPCNIEKMIHIAEYLSKDFIHVRIDFYEVNNKFYIGEMTFYSGGGYCKFEPAEWDYKFGKWLDLSNISSKYINLLPEYDNRTKVSN